MNFLFYDENSGVFIWKKSPSYKIKIGKVIAVMQCALKFLNESKIVTFQLKLIPSIYHTFFSEEIEYALFLAHAKLTRRDCLSVLDLTKEILYSKIRKRGIKKGHLNSLNIIEEDDLSGFWNEILLPNLALKHHVQPVHSLSEISLLRQKFSNNIRQFNIYHKDKIVAGTTVFVSDNVVHAQYISGNEDKNKLGSLDFLFNYLIKNVFKDKTYSITFVEHNEEPNHRDLCNGSTNHIWIKKIDRGLFNKCLSMNVGALFSNKAKYYLFHDIDLLTDKQFFYKIFQNLSRIPEGSALQAFGGRRVVVMDNNLTIRILRNTTKIDDVVPGNIESPYCTPGAPGGSIFISHDSFYKVGGFDAEFFHSYSCEDAFFYHKLEMTVGVQGCDNPLVDVFHMDHPRTNGSDNPDRHIQSLINSGFRGMSSEDKINLIEHISDNINKIK
jgi:hypothetical protein